jgi:hypothetical protein
MRVYIAVFALCLIAAIMISEPHSSPAFAKNAQAQKTDANSPKWYEPLKRPEWAAVIVAIGALLVICWQSWETRKAAQASEKNTELYISRERARLRVEMKPLTLPTNSDIPPTIDFNVSIHGPTDAFITESLCVAYLFPLAVIDDPDLGIAVMFPIHSLPNVVPANSAPLECYAFLSELGNKVLIDGAKAGDFFIGIRGFIKYKDVFDRERITAFRYVWKYAATMYALGLGEEDDGDWVRGNPEENRET